MLQVAVVPVILISGIGLLLLTMANRFARIIDRSRSLAQLRRSSDQAERQHAEAQITILWRRAKLVRRAITLASLSVLGAALLVIVLFVAAFTGVEAGWLVVALFGGTLIALIASLIAFLQDIDQSLLALKLELSEQNR
jgi:hypothetical protein